MRPVLISYRRYFWSNWMIGPFAFASDVSVDNQGGGFGGLPTASHVLFLMCSLLYSPLCTLYCYVCVCVLCMYFYGFSYNTIAIASEWVSEWANEGRSECVYMLYGWMCVDMRIHMCMCVCVSFLGAKTMLYSTYALSTALILQFTASLQAEIMYSSILNYHTIQHTETAGPGTFPHAEPETHYQYYYHYHYHYSLLNNTTTSVKQQSTTT